MAAPKELKDILDIIIKTDNHANIFADSTKYKVKLKYFDISDEKISAGKIKDIPSRYFLFKTKLDENNKNNAYIEEKMHPSKLDSIEMKNIKIMAKKLTPNPLRCEP